MEVKEVLNEELLKKYDVVIPAHVVAKLIDDKALEIAKTAKLDGFRVGKVPMNVIKARYKDSLMSDVFQHFIDTTSQDIISKNNFWLASSPKIDAINFEDNKGISFSMEFELLPAIPTINYKDIKLTKYVCDGNYEKALQEAKERFQKHNKTLTKLPAGAAAANGHTVLIDIEGAVDGAPPSIHNNDVKLELGSKSFIDGFEDGLIGSKEGEVRILNLTFPENYPVSGKNVAFTVTVKEVLEGTVPEFDDVFAQQFKYADAAALEAAIKDSIVVEYQKITDSILTKELFDYLDETIQVSLPPKLLESEIKGVEQALSSSSEANNKLASRRVKLGLVLARIIGEENIKASEEDLRTEIINRVMSGAISKDDVMKYYSTTDKRHLNALKQQLLESKCIKFLLDNITTEEQQISCEELQAKVKAIA